MLAISLHTTVTFFPHSLFLLSFSSICSCGVFICISNYAMHFLNPDNISIMEAANHTEGELFF